MSETPLEEDVLQALVGDVDPVRLEGFRFARGILPIFPLVRALFSQSELDTCLKLMLLHELMRAGGRATIDRIRSLTSFLDPARVDGLVRSLKDGGWLELRGSDHTYQPSAVGSHLLALLYGADLGSVGPDNAIARAAQTAEFNARLSGAADAMGLLLDQLRVLLEDEVAEARRVLQRGRPFQLVAWSRREHTRQLETVHQVLEHLQQRLEAASREFQRVVMLHAAMQELVRMHRGIHARLREWNLDRLHTTDAGYSVEQLAEASLGASADELMAVVDRGVISPLGRAPSLFVDEVRARFHAARRRLAPQLESFVYRSPPPTTPAAWSARDVDDVAALRARLTELLRDAGPGDPPLELEAWITAPAFAGAAWDLATLARLAANGPELALDDGRRARMALETARPHGVGAADLIGWLVAEGALTTIGAGHFARVRIGIVDG